MSVGVFVSYNHRDSKIADALVESLTSLSPDLNVFIDHAALEGGDDYEAKIARTIRDSLWFVIICSGAARSKDMGWCFFEAGQFRAKLHEVDQLRAVHDRIFYVYDVERPSQLGQYQGYNVSEISRSRTRLNFRVENDDAIAYEDTEAFDLFKTILTRSAAEPLRDLNDANVRKLMRTGVRKLTLAFADNDTGLVAEDVFQPRISFMVSAVEAGGVKPEMLVFGEYNALPNIFSIAGTSTTWGDIRTKTSALNRNGQTPLWMTDVEEAVVEVAGGGVPRQTDFLCRGNDGKFYRPIIARNEIYKNGTKKCFVAFIPSRDKRFNLNFRTSLLMSALILSVRFRQRVLPLVADIAKTGLPDKKKAETLQKLISEIIFVESESVEFGLEPPKDEHDDPPILNAFHEADDQDFIRAAMTDWSRTRATVFDVIHDAQTPTKDTSWPEAVDVVRQAMSSMRDANGQFIERLCMELMYAEKIERQG